MIKRQDDISRDRCAARGPLSSALPRPGGGLPGLPPPARHVSTYCYHREQASEALFIECSLIAHDALPLTGGVLAGLAAVPGSQAGQHNGVPRSLTLAQLLIVLALGASLHAVGQRASIATLITVSSLADVGGGAVPVPGGLGVVEAGLIAGLASAAAPGNQAVAAVLIQRFFTAGPPPVWHWATLAWIRRRESM